jgi:ribonuclease VapC
MLVDACAIVSILSNEADAPAYSQELARAERPFTSVLAVWEAVLVLARPDKLDRPADLVEELVVEWLDATSIALLAFDTPPREVLREALFAARTYGAGRRGLSNFDCFHYALAKVAGVSLLTRDGLLRATDIPTAPGAPPPHATTGT